jgi:hypothetical protein
MPSQNDKTAIVKYLEQHPRDHDSFPQANENYHQRYLAIEQYLDAHVHRVVNQGATANDGGWLTDHGPDHITTVIRRASEFALPKDASDPFLSPYEVFILLLAIHFHDVGNIFGRKLHERKINEVMHAMGGTLLGSDTGELRLICNIATAHGGYVDAEETDKDTIGPLRRQWPAQTKGPRAQLLAALLRFADELADDYTRTSRFLLESGILPPKSEVYHVYADRLREVKIQPQDNLVQIRFELTASDVQRKFGKGDGQVYLFDEIAARAIKLHYEHVYCSRFLVPYVLIDTIAVTINISSDISADRFVAPIHRIGFQMQQSGYPDKPTSLGEIDPEMIDINGESLKAAVSAMETRQARGI